MPADAAGYKIEVADDLRPYLGDIVNDAGLAELRGFAAENKWTQGQLDDTFKLMNHFREKGFLGESFDPAAETAALGDNGRGRQEDQELFLSALKDKGVLDDASFGELMTLVPLAAGTKALEALRKHFGPGAQSVEPDAQVADTKEGKLAEYQRMRNDPKYETDSAWRRKADQLFVSAYA